MPSNEDLYRDLEAQEDAEAQRYGIKPAPMPKRKEVNVASAMERYNRDIAPVIAAQKRIAAGKAPTTNPLTNLWLKVTGRAKLPTPEVVNPNDGMAIVHGQTADEVRKEMIEDPEAFPGCRQKPPVIEPK